MISIILPVYNVELYLERCLESIYNQTYDNFELIIINDGSTDNSKRIIDIYMEKYSNIIYLEQSNSGLSVARNLGLKRANGKYILFVDSDDYLKKTALMLMNKEIIENDIDIGIFGHYEIYENESKIISVKYDNYVNVSKECIGDLIIEGKIFGVAWNKIIKTSYARSKNLLFEPNRFTQDWFPLLKLTCETDNIRIISEPLYYYNIREGSTTALKTTKRYEDYTFAVTSIIGYILSNQNLFSQQSIMCFKINTFSKRINLFHNSYDEQNKKSVYSKFSLENPIDLDLGIFDLIIIPRIGWRTKIEILLWKLKLFHLMK